MNAFKRLAVGAGCAVSLAFAVALLTGTAVRAWGYAHPLVAEGLPVRIEAASIDVTFTGKPVVSYALTNLTHEPFRALQVAVYVFGASGNPKGSKVVAVWRTVPPKGTVDIASELAPFEIDSGDQVVIAPREIRSFGPGGWRVAGTHLTAAARALVAGQTSEPPQARRVDTLELACGRDFCIEERKDCQALCTRCGVLQFDCTIGKDSCSSSCRCNPTC